MSKDNVTRKVSIYINGKEVENSLKGVEGGIVHTKNALRKLVEGSTDYEQKSTDLKNTLSQLKEKQSQYRDELGLTNKTMKETGEISGGLRGSLSGIWDSLVSGDLKGAKDGINELKDGMGGLVKSSLAFITSPIGLAIAGLAGFAAGAKAMFDFNINAEKGAQLIENLSGKTGQVVEDIRVKIQSLSDTFKVGFDELAGAIDNLVDTGVAKDEFDAIAQIKEGLLSAPDKNEFVSSLESTAVIAKQLGLDINGVIALKKQIEETGVDPEATFGAMSKATNNLKLQTEGLREKLSSAFGASFSDEVLAKVKTGQITTIQALDLIGKKSTEVGLNQTQQAELGKELFGKSAIAAGGYATVLDTVVKAQQNQGKELNANQKALDDLEKANLRLGQAQSDLFRVKGFGEIWTGIKAKATDTLASILEWISDIKQDIQPLIDFVGVVFANAWEGLKLSVSNAFNIIGGILRGFVVYFSTVFGVIKKILTGDFSGALDVLKNGFVRLGNIVGDTFGKIKNSIISALQGILTNVKPFLEAIGIDVDKINKKLESFKNKEVELKTKTTSTDGGGSNKPSKEELQKLKDELAEQQKVRDEARKAEADKARKAREEAAAKKKAAQEKEAKEEYDRLKALADAKANLAKAELNYFIVNNRSLLESGQKLTADLLAAEINRLSLINDERNDELAAERLRNIAKAEETAKSADELNILKQTIDLEYLTKQQELDLAFQQQTDALKKQYEEEQKQLKVEQLLLDNELALEEATTKEEADAIKRKQDYDKRLLEFKDFRDKGKITEDEYNRFIIALDKQTKENERIAQLQSTQNKLNELGKLADATTAIFGQNKATASATALINGGLAVTEILKTPSTFPEPFASISRGIQIAGAISTTAKSLSQINSAKAPVRAGFFYGGDTGTDAALGYDKYGPITGYVHKNEYVIPEVMTQDPIYADTISWLEHSRQQKLKGFVDGGESSPGIVSNTNINQSNNETSLLISVLNQLTTILSSGIMAKLFLGYKDIEAIEKMKNDLNNSSQNGTIS